MRLPAPLSLVASLAVLAPLALVLPTTPAGAAEAAAVAATAAASAAVPVSPAAPVPASSPRAPRLPITAFAKLPLLADVQLSDDGKRAAAIVNHDNDSVVAVVDLDAPRRAIKPIWKAPEGKLRISWVKWVGDRLLVGLRFPAERAGIETTETRLVSFKADGSDARQFFRLGSDEEPPQFQDDVIDDLHDGRHVLVQLRGMPEDVGLAVYRVDVATGERERVQASSDHVTDWIVDQQHRVRAGVRIEDTTISLVVRAPDSGQGDWKRLFDAEVFGADVVTPIGFDRDPDKLYVSANHEGRRAVFVMDLAAPGQPRTLKLADDRFDTGGELIVSPRTHEAVGIRNANEGENAYWDEDYKGLGRGLAKALPDRINTLLQLTDGEGRYLVLSEGNGVPPEYWLGDTTTHSLDLLARTYPQLPEASLATKAHVTLKARDGLALPSLLTLPVGSTGRGLPAVVLPHGGPLSNDDDTFDPWSQFLANRGIAVLQVNFRGSTGFGHDLMAAGLRRWGLEMQDDITDATKWLVASGVADPKRICIVGGSYGGYAALMGAVKEPALYRCVVSFAGVTDLYLLMQDARNYTNAKIVEKQVASIDGDIALKRRTSPRYQADRIQAPVLLVHGTLDRSVPFEQGEAMADELRSAHKDVRFVVQKGGDHHLSRYDQNLEFLTELDAFLAKHLQLDAK